MKFMLIAFNVLLAAGICHLAWITVSDPVVLESKTPVAARSASDRKVKPTVPAGRAALKVDPPSVVEEKIAALNAKNIFNVERVPEAPVSKAAAARANNQQIRLGMSLVGTYSIGDALGAIILQRIQGNSQQLLKELQQKEYEQFLASSRVTDPKKKAQGDGQSAGEGEDDADDSAEAPAIRSITMNPSVSANNVIRQRLKVGDTTLNGYTLVEVTRTSAKLTKGKETVELPLLTPSEASNQARQNNNRNTNNNNNRNNNNNANNNNNNNNNRNNQQANNNNNNRNNNNANNNANRNNNNNNRNNNNNANRNNNNNNANRNNNNNNNANRNNNNNNRDDSGIIWF